VGDGTAGGAAVPVMPLADALDGYERQLIAAALSAAAGNVADAARRLATDRANLYRRMRRLGLESPRHLSD
jgi:transcriptional regulator with GAF, ATPase, and Fis domain